ncbi:MAG: hypothetical protein R3F44_01255 [Candidatus Competibacteraceae bacterium]
MRQLLAEIEARLIPPAGNRLIVVNATGELALVGYAVNLIGSHPEPPSGKTARRRGENRHGPSDRGADGTGDRG